MHISTLAALSQLGRSPANGWPAGNGKLPPGFSRLIKRMGGWRCRRKSISSAAAERCCPREWMRISGGVPGSWNRSGVL